MIRFFDKHAPEIIFLGIPTSFALLTLATIIVR